MKITSGPDPAGPPTTTRVTHQEVFQERGLMVSLACRDTERCVLQQFTSEKFPVPQSSGGQHETLGPNACQAAYLAIGIFPVYSHPVCQLHP